ncbi:MAG: VWA domain-containing protein [Myxococcota bacterium]
MRDDEQSQAQLRRWRLILGKQAESTLSSLGGDALELDHDQRLIDEALAAIYDDTSGEEGDGGRGAGQGPSAPRLARWLGDIRTYFQEDVVTVIQQDAIERKGMTSLLFEPEMLKNVQPSVALVGTLISLRGQIPERTKDTARSVVRSVVDQIRLSLEQKVRQAVMGALNRSAHSPIPHASHIDWKWTIGRNLKNYRPELGRIVPERVYFYARAQRTNNWTVIVDMDQSGSMAESVVYGAVTGAILASLPAVDTRVVAFDTEVVDLTEQCGDDPVDMLFGVQLGGGTDINKSVAYCQKFVTDPARTLFFMITDLFEGGNEVQLVKRLEHMVRSGVRVICLLALSDSGVPSYDEGLARKLARLGIPCFGCSPQRLPQLLEGALKGADLSALATELRSA